MKKQKVFDRLIKTRVFKKIYYFIRKNKISRGISLNSSARLINCHFFQEKGSKNNKIIIGCNTSMIKCKVFFYGSDNTLIIGNNCGILGNSFIMYDDNNEIIIGDSLNSADETQIISLEGKKINVGSGCLFSYGIEIRNSDSHSIVDSDGKRMNIAKDIIIEDNVWIAQRSLILKGARLLNGCVVGANSLLTSHTYDSCCVYAGIPAKKIKDNVKWDINRI